MDKLGQHRHNGQSWTMWTIFDNMDNLGESWTKWTILDKKDNLRQNGQNGQYRQYG